MLILKFISCRMNSNNYNKMAQYPEPSQKMPLLFVGHGNPMNAIEENEFVEGWRSSAKSFPKPEAILCISAHWETNGTLITAMEKPKTIHDFRGFPQKLFDVQYPAPGNPELAQSVQQKFKSIKAELDLDWGLDHGCWSVIKHMYPEADIPVLQMSIDYTISGSSHFNLAKELKRLREKGILILGSGNMVHNLRKVDWSNPGKGYDWAIEVNENFKSLMLKEEFDTLCNPTNLGSAYDLAVPSPEHYIPLLYILALKEKNEQISFFNDKTIMGSISMTSLKIG